MPSSRSRYLILACLGLGLLVWFDNRRPSDPSGAPSDPLRSASNSVAPVQPAPTPSAGPGASAAGQVQLDNPLASLDKAELKDTVERPLFSPSRRRPPVKAADHSATQVEAKAEPPSFDLLGVMRDGNHEIALLRKKSDGTNFRVEVGDTIGGWRVSKMEPTSILLERDGTSQTVPLFE